jgi:hypothetical protein
LSLSYLHTYYTTGTQGMQAFCVFLLLIISGSYKIV